MIQGVDPMLDGCTIATTTGSKRIRRIRRWTFDEPRIAIPGAPFIEWFDPMLDDQRSYSTDSCKFVGGRVSTVVKDSDAGSRT
jgi:hypothetical protein